MNSRIRAMLEASATNDDVFCPRSLRMTDLNVFRTFGKKSVYVFDFTSRKEVRGTYIHFTKKHVVILQHIGNSWTYMKMTIALYFELVTNNLKKSVGDVVTALAGKKHQYSGIKTDKTDMNEDEAREYFWWGK